MLKELTPRTLDRLAGFGERLSARLVAAAFAKAGMPARAALRRWIPCWVRSKVYRRDAGCCVFTSDDGRRCGSRRGLEFDHIRPWAMGGRSDDPATWQPEDGDPFKGDRCDRAQGAFRDSAEEQFGRRRRRSAGGFLLNWLWRYFFPIARR